MLEFALACSAVWYIWRYGSIFESWRQAIKARLQMIDIVIYLAENPAEQTEAAFPTPEHHFAWWSYTDSCSVNRWFLFTVRPFFYEAWLCATCLAVHVPVYLLLSKGLFYLLGLASLWSLLQHSLAATAIILILMHAGHLNKGLNDDAEQRTA